MASRSLRAATSLKDASALAPVRRALISVSDKSGLPALGNCLQDLGVEILSTGGTATALRDAGIQVQEVSEYTESPEILGGRVKSLHPKIHGGILSVRGNHDHDEDLAANGIHPIDLVVVNLYPFRETVASGADFAQCMENIDIGGPTMLRAAAKNNAHVCSSSSPSQYEDLINELVGLDCHTSADLRRRFAAEAFLHSSEYEAAISAYMAEATLEGTAVAGTPPGTAFVNAYGSFSEFKYGCNPHQQPAGILRCDRTAQDSPFEVINGKPGYINMLDAANAWQLVDELRDATGITAATSFKHVSPAGAALAVPLKKEEADAYEIPNPDDLSPAALAYVRARQADPMSSFGDFAAISCKVDEATAKTLKPLVCDGIVAPEFSPAAIDILRKKKGGNFIILQADRNFQPPELEFREVFGTCLMQKRNSLRLSVDEHLESNVVCGEQPSEEVLRDMILSLTVLKYTQSNSVGYAKNGQMVGVGAGQQSRVDCCKLAGRKVAVWALRQHPKVMALKFKDGVKKQDRVNARVRYIEGDFTPIEWESWSSLFTEAPPPLTADEKANFMSSFCGVTLSSDAFFPFRDSIDHASKFGVDFVVQPGGSVGDESVKVACEEYGMAMIHTGVRLFHH